MPGNTSRLNSSRSTLPNAWCEIADAPVVKHSAACTVALATGGATPVVSNRLVAVMP